MSPSAACTGPKDTPENVCDRKFIISAIVTSSQSVRSLTQKRQENSRRVLQCRARNRISPMVERNFGEIISLPDSLIGFPVHSFRLIWKLFAHVWAATQFHSDFLRSTQAALVHGFLLALIRKPIAITAREQATAAVKLGDSSSTVPPI
jgi:hypothetical protein